MIDVAENIKQMKKELPQSVTLVAVSKFHPTEALMAAYDAGQRVFGESRAQELVQKAAMCNGISSGICRPTKSRLWSRL